MHSVEIVLRSREVCVRGVRRESRPLRRPPWGMCTSALMEGEGRAVEGGRQSLSSHCV